jgi:hypothetical protein
VLQLYVHVYGVEKYAYARPVSGCTYVVSRRNRIEYAVSRWNCIEYARPRSIAEAYAPAYGVATYTYDVHVFPLRRLCPVTISAERRNTCMYVYVR